MSNETDDELLVRFRNGDASALDVLFLRHYAAVYRALFGLTGSRETAEDLVTETFLSFKDNPPQPRPHVPLKAWIFRVAMNLGHNHNRGKRREELRTERIAAEAQSTVNDPLAIILKQHDRDTVRTVLGSLPERQSKILLLRNTGLSYKEVAASMQIAPSSVGTYLARAEKSFVAAYHHLSNQELDDRDAPVVGRADLRI